MSSEEAHTPIVANAARLLADSKLLLNHSRYASATALAVLALEELGKVILNLWGDPPYGARRHKRMSDHLRKQRAVASLLMADHVVEDLSGSIPSAGPITEELVKNLAQMMAQSKSGRFQFNVEAGVIDKVKQLGFYRDHWFAAAGLHADQFDASDVEEFHKLCRQTVRAISHARTMHVGREIYHADLSRQP